MSGTRSATGGLALRGSRLGPRKPEPSVCPRAAVSTFVVGHRRIGLLRGMGRRVAYPRFPLPQP